MEKASSLGPLWLLQMSAKSMQISFLLFHAQNDLNVVSSGNLNTQKDHEDEVFLQNNILFSVAQCTKFSKYVTIQMIACAL